jgi:hypothetical protein
LLFLNILFLILNSCILLHVYANIFVLIVLLMLPNDWLVSSISIKRASFFLVSMLLKLLILLTIHVYNGYLGVIIFASVLYCYWITTGSIANKFIFCAWNLIIRTSLDIPNCSCSIFYPLPVIIFILFPLRPLNLLFRLYNLFWSQFFYPISVRIIVGGNIRFSLFIIYIRIISIISLSFFLIFVRLLIFIWNFLL